jgi:pterin-4a-carbinolamine dehydratase
MIVRPHGLARRKSARTFGKARLTIWTHKIDGLNEVDFIIAAKADALA